MWALGYIAASAGVHDPAARVCVQLVAGLSHLPHPLHLICLLLLLLLLLPGEDRPRRRRALPW